MNAKAFLQEYWREAPVSFLSVDTEGTDINIIRSIDFDKYPFDIVQVEKSEHLGHDTLLLDFLQNKNYFLVAQTNVNFIFLRKSTI